jgi:membrane-associated phospholipid phosphatase
MIHRRMLFSIGAIVQLLVVSSAHSQSAGGAEPQTPAAEPVKELASSIPIYLPESSWYQGSAGHRRLWHLGASALGGVAYLGSETVLKSSLAADTCRWCTPPGIDASVRSSLMWNDTKKAARLADLDGYLIAPLFGLGAMAVSAAMESRGEYLSQAIDDSLPVIESIVIAQLVTQTVKFSVGRQRPFVHFAQPGRSPETDDNLSFLSGHSSLVFSIATSAGMVAHRRGYRSETVIWIAGMSIAASTAYLRIAADKHYFTDVVAGSGLGAAVGLAVPLLLHNQTLQQAQVSIVPSRNGLLVSGTW